MNVSLALETSAPMHLLFGKKRGGKLKLKLKIQDMASGEPDGGHARFAMYYSTTMMIVASKVHPCNPFGPEEHLPSL